MPGTNLQGGASHMGATGSSGRDMKRIDYVIGISNMTWPGIAAVMSGFANLTAAGMRTTNVMNTAMSRMEGAMLAAGGAAAIGMGLATAEAAKFEKEMKVVQALIMQTGDSSGDLQKRMESMAASAKNLAIEYGKSPEEVAKGFQVLGRAGLETTEEMTNTMKAALQLSVIEGITASEASKMAIQLTTLFGGDMEQDVMKFAEILAHAANISTVSASEIMTGMRHAGGIAASIYPAATPEDMYKNAQDVAAMIATLSQKGVSGSMAGIAVKSFVNYMVKDMPKSIKALKKIGLTPDDLMEVDPNTGNKVYKKPLEVIELFDEQLEKAGKTSQAEKYQWLVQWGEPRQAQQYIKLFPEYDARTGKSEWLLKKYTDEMENEYNAQARVNVIMESASQKISKMSSALQVLMVNVGSVFLPILSALATGLEYIAKIAGENPFVAWGIGITLLAVAFGGLWAVMRWLAPAFVDFKGSLALLGKGNVGQALIHGQQGRIAWARGTPTEKTTKKSGAAAGGKNLAKMNCEQLVQCLNRQSVAMVENTAAAQSNAKVKAVVTGAHTDYITGTNAATQVTQNNTRANIANASSLAALNTAATRSGAYLGKERAYLAVPGTPARMPLITPGRLTPVGASGVFGSWLDKNTKTFAERTYLRQSIMGQQPYGIGVSGAAKERLNALARSGADWQKLSDSQERTLKQQIRNQNLYRQLQTSGIAQRGVYVPGLGTTVPGLYGSVGAGARGNIWGVDPKTLQKDPQRHKAEQKIKEMGEKTRRENKKVLDRQRNRIIGQMYYGGAAGFGSIPTPKDEGRYLGSPAYPGVIPPAAFAEEDKKMQKTEKAYKKGVQRRQQFMNKIRSFNSKLGAGVGGIAGKAGGLAKGLAKGAASGVSALGAGAAGLLGMTGPQAAALLGIAAAVAGAYYVAKAYGLLETGEAKFTRALKEQKIYVDQLDARKTRLAARESYLLDLQKKGIQQTTTGKSVTEELLKTQKDLQDTKENLDYAKANYEYYEKWGKKVQAFTKNTEDAFARINAMKLSPPEIESPETKQWTDKMKEMGGMDLASLAPGMAQQAKIVANILADETKITREYQNQSTLKGKYFATPEGHKKLVEASETSKSMFRDQMRSTGKKWNPETMQWEDEQGLGYLWALTEGYFGKTWTGTHYLRQTGQLPSDPDTKAAVSFWGMIVNPVAFAESQRGANDSWYQEQIDKQKGDDWFYTYNSETGNWDINPFNWFGNIAKTQEKATQKAKQKGGGTVIQSATFNLGLLESMTDFGAKIAEYVIQNPGGNAPNTGEAK